ncbi:MAG: glycosyl hydrolase, partial [Ignavibacteria bacterium]|nr:glycosyl hydrolase [Ignavibacteria bacterium]
FNWQTPIHLSVHNPDVIYLGSQFLHRSADKGDSFTVISKDLTKEGRKGEVPYGTLTTIHESPLIPGLIYTGSDDGMVYVTKDDGNSWTRIINGLPENLWVSRVIASGFDTGTVYVSLNGYRWDNFEPYVYKSTNYGTDWFRIGVNLPLEPVNVIREDPSDKNIIYTGTDAGIYVSIDGGKDFNNMNGNMPNAPVHDIVIHPEQNEIIAGTHGRSVYVASLESLRQIAGGKLKNLQLLAVKKVKHSKNRGKRTFDWRYNLPENPAVEFYSANNGPVKFTVKTEDGLTLFEKQIKSVRGLNYFDYDLSVDGENAGEYSELVNIDKKAKYGKRDNGKYYLWKGKYTVGISGSGEIDEAILEIFEPDEP